MECRVKPGNNETGGRPLNQLANNFALYRFRLHTSASRLSGPAPANTR
jgi:hypothetical protein